MTENEKKQIELTCDIVGDLLPLYYDGVVSEGTKRAVDTHLAACSQCSKEYELLKEELPEADDKEEKGEENRIRVFLKQVRKQGILKGMAVTVIAVAFLMGAGYFLTEVPLISASSESVSAEYLFEEEGNYFIVYKAPKYKNPTTLKTKYDKEKKQMHMDYKIPIIHVCDDGEVWDIITLDKENFGQEDFQPENIFFKDKNIYSSKDNGNQKEAPEYVKTYFEYRELEDGFTVRVDEFGIGLGVVKEVDGQYVENFGYKEWDWEGNLIHNK